MEVITLQLHIIACAFMCGVIWIIQSLHYPAFAKIQESEFAAFHAHHSSTITNIVGPAMLVELVTAAILVFRAPTNLFLWFNLGVVILLWLSTGLLSVPLHTRLAAGQDLKIVRRLVVTNWPRTVMWSARLLALSIYAGS